MQNWDLITWSFKVTNCMWSDLCIFVCCHVTAFRYKHWIPGLRQSWYWASLIEMVITRLLHKLPWPWKSLHPIRKTHRTIMQSTLGIYRLFHRIILTHLGLTHSFNVWLPTSTLYQRWTVMWKILPNVRRLSIYRRGIQYARL